MREGFVEAVRAAGGEAVILDRVAEQPGISSDASTPLSRVPWLAERLGGLPKPLAVMAEDDRFAIDVVSACLLSGLRIPDEVGVLGTDNDPRRYPLSPHPISSVDTDLFAVGYRAAALLERIMNGEAVAAEAVVVAPKGVVVRASTDTYALAGADVRAAYAWLCEHFRERRCASAAARESGTPVRTLQMRFKRATGRTLSEETTRLRLQHACQLLQQTQLKLTAIALETGFSSYAHFCGLFERMIGLKPSDYRDKHQCTP
jgi:LacI family transcriptional regulator